MNEFQKGAEQYRKGMHTAKVQCEHMGREWARDNYRYGLNGCSDTFCKGYRDYLTHYAPVHHTY